MEITPRNLPRDNQDETGFSGLAGFIFALGLALWFPLFPKMIRIMDGLLIGIGGVWIAFIMARRK